MPSLVGFDNQPKNHQTCPTPSYPIMPKHAIVRTQKPIGRFAPSPTGQLHLGSLVSALSSYCHIKALGGLWLLRIEDTDHTRCRPEHSDRIIDDLAKLGLHSDLPIVYQSARTDLYEQYLQKLHKLSYSCSCSRKALQDQPIYPRHCLGKNDPTQKLRLALPDVDMVFFDALQGIVCQNPQKTLGDVVVKRQDGVINYIFACAIDDALQGVTHLVRGLDILPMTTAQLFIQKMLGLSLPTHFCHLPLILNQNGQKLSKQTLATPIDTNNPSQLLCYALRLLGQTPPKGLSAPNDILAHAVAHWHTAPLKKQTLAVI